MKNSWFTNKYLFSCWKDVVTLVSAFIVADCLTSFEKIRSVVFSLTEYDSTYNSKIWVFLISILIVTYVVRNVHGLLITYNLELEEKSLSSRVQTVLFFLVSFFIIISVTVNVRIHDILVENQTLFYDSLYLFLLILLPSVVWFALDCIQIGFVYTDQDFTFDALVRELLRKPSDRPSISACKYIWLTLSLFSALSVIVWYLLFYIFDGNSAKICLTWSILAINLATHSVVDYCLNCNFFFFGFEESSPSDDSGLRTSAAVRPCSRNRRRP